MNTLKLWHLLTHTEDTEFYSISYFLFQRLTVELDGTFALTDYLPSKYKYKTLEFLYRCSRVVIVVAVRIKAALYRKLFPYDFISRKDSYSDKISSKREYIVSCR